MTETTAELEKEKTPNSQKIKFLRLFEVFSDLRDKEQMCKSRGGNRMKSVCRLFALTALLCFLVRCSNVSGSSNNDRYMLADEETKLFFSIIRENLAV